MQLLRVPPIAILRQRCLASPSVQRFPGHESGQVIIFFALLASALFGFAGFAVDYSRGVRAQGVLQESLDAAVLAAVQEETREAAQIVLDGFLASRSQALPATVSATIDSFDGEVLVARAEMALQATLGAILGDGEMAIKVRASAERASHYQELHFAVDLSGSVGMGATEADRAALEQLTQPYVGAMYGARLPQGCAFGCHRREGWEPGTKTVYEMARDAGIKLREDELIHQFNGLIDLLLDPADEAVQKGMRKVSVVAFSNWATQLIAPSDQASAVKAVLPNFPRGERFETNYQAAFDEFTRLLGTQGSGSETNPKKMLILITDGIESRDAFFAQRSIDLNLCNALRQRGFRLAVVELKYPKLFSNALYDDTVLPVETSISPTIEQCASPGWYFQAVDNTDIPAKFAELKERIAASTAHLVQ